MSTTTEKTEEKPTEEEAAILAVVAQDPSMSQRELGRRLKKLGIVKHTNSVYHKLRKSDYLRRELPELERLINEDLHRNLYYLANKGVEKALKNNDLPDGIKYNYHKLVFDKVHGEKHINASPTQVNIGNIEKIQVAIKGKIEQKLSQEGDNSVSQEHDTQAVPPSS